MEFTKDISFNNNPKTNQDTTITYSGFLAGSDELFIVYGFGENWENTTEAKMSKLDDTFLATVKMLNSDTFNFCFRNSDYEWDNNSNCNYISPILPLEELKKVQSFDIDALIEEILEPLEIKFQEKLEQITVENIETTPADLGAEISNILSGINLDANKEDLKEYSSLDEILSASVIEQKTIEFTENEETPDLEKSLIPLDDRFVVSPRRLSSFYLFKKRLKLALYKTFIKLPKMILGLEDE